MSDSMYVDGKLYVRASVLAERAGQTGDSISRLCRTAKVEGRLIERTWWVAEDSFTAYIASREFRKEERVEALREERAREYREHVESDKVDDENGDANTSSAPAPSFVRSYLIITTR